MKMYIRIEGDEDQQGASYEIRGSVFFLQQAIIGLFNSLVRFSHGDIIPALKCLEELTGIIEEETKGGIRMYEVIISGGPSDSHILGEFHSVADAADMIKAYNQSEHHPDECLIIRRMEV